MKDFRFINEQAYREFQQLPEVPRNEFATSLNAIASDQGLLPNDQYREGRGVTVKSLSASDWRGVVQLSINGSPAFRVVCCAKFGDRLYILHSWTKTANGRDKKAMTTVGLRYKEMMKELRGEGLVK